MLQGLQNKIHNTVARTARKAALGLGASLCLLAGLGFLTLAAWIYLVSVTTALNAALVLGGIYTGVGLILVVVLSVDDDREPRKKPKQQDQSDNHEMLAKMVAAFMTGVTAGRKSRS